MEHKVYVLMGMLHSKLTGSLTMKDVNRCVYLAREFNKRYGKIPWDDRNKIEDAVVVFYNRQIKNF